MLRCSDLVCKGTKAIEALTDNLVLVSAVPAESTSMVTVTQKITKTQLVYLKQRGAQQVPGESFTVGLTRLEGSGRTSNGWPKAMKPHNLVEAAFILKGILR